MEERYDMKRSEIQETPGFRPEGLHPGYGVFVQLLSQIPRLEDPRSGRV
jgi:hypothetical protein